MDGEATYRDGEAALTAEIAELEAELASVVAKHEAIVRPYRRAHLAWVAPAIALLSLELMFDEGCHQQNGYSFEFNRVSQENRTPPALVALGVTAYAGIAFLGALAWASSRRVRLVRVHYAKPSASLRAHDRVDALALAIKRARDDLPVYAREDVE